MLERNNENIIKPAISIVLATKGDKAVLLERCMKSLQRQTFKDYEVIVVYSFFPIGASKLFENDNVFAFKEKSSTLSAARNLGIIYSKGDIVVFIDDDAEAPENWLSKIYSTFQLYPSLVCLGGPNLTPTEERKKHPLRFVQGSFLESRMGQNISLDRSAVGRIAGCNVGYRKAIFEKIGYLNEKLKSGEDWEFHIRIAENGYNMRFDPEISVWHHRQGLKHVFLNSSKMVPFFLSWKTLKYSRYEPFFASFYSTNIAFLLLLIILFISPFVFILLLASLLFGHFVFAMVRTKTYDWRIIYYPLQILVTLTQIMGFYFGIFKIIGSKLKN
jgi:glycosyltransferase involved in cell wall biosynthesis